MKVTSQPVSVTLAIPTYNRLDAIIGNLSHIISNDITSLCNVIIIDNNSSDGSFKKLSYLGEGIENLKILRNNKNIGGCANIVRLFEECQTEYIIICSDEDYIIKEHIEDLTIFLREFSPGFVSPQLYKPKLGLYRGKRAIKKIRPHEFQSAAGPVSGLVFNAKLCCKLIEINRQQLLDNRQQWPHVLLVAWLLIDNVSCFWWDRPLNKVIHSLEGGFDVKEDGVLSAWEHYKVTLNALEGYRPHNCFSSNVRKKKVVEAHRSKLVTWLAKGAGKVGLGRCFAKSAVRYIFGLLLKKVRNIISPSLIANKFFLL